MDGLMEPNVFQKFHSKYWLTVLCYSPKPSYLLKYTQKLFLCFIIILLLFLVVSKCLVRFLLFFPWPQIPAPPKGSPDNSRSTVEIYLLTYNLFSSSPSNGVSLFIRRILVRFPNHLTPAGSYLFVLATLFWWFGSSRIMLESILSNLAMEPHVHWLCMIPFSFLAVHVNGS